MNPSLFFLLAGLSAQGVPLETDLVYSTVDGVELGLDLARPAAAASPAPLVICIHGGGWQKGGKQTYRPLLQLLAASGYAAATIDYRLAPAHKFPAQIDDVRVAVRFLRQKAQEWSLDAERITVLGDSAGGHLALLAALKQGPAKNRRGCESAKEIDLVVNFYGGADLARWQPPEEGEALIRAGFDGKASSDLLFDLLGTRDRNDPVYKRASPVTYIDACDPPVLSFHGDSDLLVPMSQSEILHEALRKAGVEEELVIVPGQGHGWSGAELERTARITLEFLSKHLRKQGPDKQ
jgi:acetyl esterase/lipase